MERNKVVTLIYTGRRLNGKALVHVYAFKNSVTDVMIFKKPLEQRYAIGTALICELTETGVKGPYKLDLTVKSDKEQIREWSLEEVCDVESYNSRKQASDLLEGDFKELVKQVKNAPYGKRKLLVRWLLTQLY